MKTYGDVIQVHPSRVRPFPGQPREYFNVDELASLQASIKQRGQIQPGLVKELPDGSEHDFELVDGQRRWTACLELDIPFCAVIIDPVDEAEQFEISITANFQSSPHTPMEIAKACVRLYDAGRSDVYIGNLFGYSQFWVGRYRYLVNLIPELQTLMDPAVVPSRNDRLKTTIAQDLARMEPAEQRAKFKQIQCHGLASVNTVEVRHQLRNSGIMMSRGQRPKRQTELIGDGLARVVSAISGFQFRLKSTDGMIAALQSSGRLEEIEQSIDNAQRGLARLREMLDLKKKLAAKA